MRLVIGYDLGNGPETVNVGPAAIIGFERANHRPISKLATDGFGLTEMTDLAWRQLVLEDRYAGTLDEFVATLVDVDVAPGIADPTSRVEGP